MLRIYRRRLLIGLMLLMLLFALIGVLAIIDFNKGIPLFGFGMPVVFENSIIFMLSLIGVIKSVHEIIKVEHIPST